MMRAIASPFIRYWLLKSCLSPILAFLLFPWPLLAGPVPPDDDIPEAILRTEIITQARSPVTGQPLTATEYEELLEYLATDTCPPKVNPELERFIFLLKVRKFFKTLFPFLT